MYVRWKKRAQTRGKEPTGDYLLDAVLVKSVRVAGVGVRQEFIAHLGTILERGVNMYYRQRDFWTTIDAALDKQQLEPPARAIIERSIEKVVAKPTSEGKAAALAKLARIESKL